MAWTAALAILVAAAVAGTSLALLNQDPGQASAGTSRTGNGSVGTKTLAELAMAGVVRTQAAQWIARQVSRSAIIECDAVMCGTLYKAGVPTSRVLVISPTAPDPLGGSVIVATPVLRSQFGARLASEYAPAVLASFGRGPLRVDVRVIAPFGAAAYDASVRRDLAARQRAGTALLGLRQIGLARRAATDLAAGRVDARLLVMLPVLAKLHPIKVIRFYGQPPGASPYVPLTGVELSGNDRHAGLTAHAYQRWLVSFFRGQRSVFRPASVTTTASSNGAIVVTVRFALPDPIGLIHQ